MSTTQIVVTLRLELEKCQKELGKKTQGISLPLISDLIDLLFSFGFVWFAEVLFDVIVDNLFRLIV